MLSPISSFSTWPGLEGRHCLLHGAWRAVGLREHQLNGRGGEKLKLPGEWGRDTLGEEAVTLGGLGRWLVHLQGLVPPGAVHPHPLLPWEASHSPLSRPETEGPHLVPPS